MSLASRLAYKDKKTENAILFLEALAKKTEDERLKKEYETRIQRITGEAASRKVGVGL